MTEMKEGEKYLNIKIVGHDWIAAFPNKTKKSDKEPDFRGDGVAVWVRKKSAQAEQKKKVEVEDIL